MVTRIRDRAIRRSGELLKQIEPAHGANQNIGGGAHTKVLTRKGAGRKTGGGAAPSFSRERAAVEGGLSADQAKRAIRVANVPQAEFDRQVESDDATFENAKGPCAARKSEDPLSVRKRIWTAKGETRSAWQADYTDGQGVRRRKTFHLKKDADAFEKRAGTEVADGVHVPDSASITIAEAGQLWLTAKRRSGRERVTVDQYRQHLELHIVPFIGSKRLNAFTALVLAKFEDDLIAAGRSPTMVKKVRVSLGSIIANAQRRGLTIRNVVRELRGSGSDARAERRGKRRLKVGEDIPSPKEVRAIVGALQGRWRPLFLTAIFTGLRASELRGLSWADVDLDKRTIHVRQRADRFNLIGSPKSATSERDVPLPPIVASALREWRLGCPRREGGKLDLVFPNGEGRVENLGNIINRGLIPAQLAAGVTVDSGKKDVVGRPIMIAKYTGMHALRHFYASWCINSRSAGGLGLGPKEVQERLGHATMAMTTDVYAHLFPRHDSSKELAAAERALLG